MFVSTTTATPTTPNRLPDGGFLANPRNRMHVSGFIINNSNSMEMGLKALQITRGQSVDVKNIIIEYVVNVVRVVRAATYDESVDIYSFFVFDEFVAEFVESFLIDSPPDDWEIFRRKFASSLVNLKSAITRFRSGTL